MFARSIFAFIFAVQMSMSGVAYANGNDDEGRDDTTAAGSPQSGDCPIPSCNPNPPDGRSNVLNNSSLTPKDNQERAEAARRGSDDGYGDGYGEDGDDYGRDGNGGGIMGSINSFFKRNPGLFYFGAGVVAGGLGTWALTSLLHHHDNNNGFNHYQNYPPPFRPYGGPLYPAPGGYPGFTQPALGYSSGYGVVGGYGYGGQIYNSPTPIGATPIGTVPTGTAPSGGAPNVLAPHIN